MEIRSRETGENSRRPQVRTTKEGKQYPKPREYGKTSKPAFNKKPGGYDGVRTHKKKIVPDFDSLATLIDDIIDESLTKIFEIHGENLMNATIHVDKTADNYINQLVLTKMEDGEAVKDRGLNIYMVTNIKICYTAIIITNREMDGHRILFNHISANPTAAIKKYLPNIVETLSNILMK